LICTPEYAGGAPGVLKNALDWSVSGMDFSKKPTALITASLAGKFTHQSLLGTLLTIDAHMVDSSHLLVSMIRSKINMEGTIIDETTRNQIEVLIDSLYAMIQYPDEQAYLAPPVLN
jgi:chromate reductase, NAD(P)H dehydrogenase (quinone)